MKPESQLAEDTSLRRRLYARYTPFAWNGLAYALPRAAVLAAGLYVASRWGHESFARYSLAATTLMLVGNLVGASIGTVASKYVPHFALGNADSHGRGFAAIAVVGAALALALGIGLWIAAPALALAFGVDPPITGLLRAAALGVAPCILNGTALGLLAGGGNFRQAAMMNATASLAFAVTLVPLNAVAGPAGTLVALAVFYFVSTLGALRVVGRPIAHDWKNSRRIDLRSNASTILRYFIPMLVAAGMITPVAWLSSALLSHYGDALLEVARFSAGYNWFAVVSAIPAVLAQVEFVRMARARAIGDTRRLSDVLRTAVAQNFALVAPVTVTGMILAGPLMGLFQVDDAAARLTLRLLLGAALFASLGNPAGMFLAVTERIWLASLLNFGWGLVVLACSWWLRDEGAIGVGIGFLIGYGAHFLVASTIAWRVASRHSFR